MSTNKNAKSIKDIMSSNVVWVAPNAKLSEVAQKMKANDCGCVLVGENDRLVGVVTDRDIVLRAVAACANMAQATAQDAMTAKVLYCRESDSLDAAAKNMADNQVRRLVVLDANKRLVGVVSIGDVATTSLGESLTGTALSEICRPGLSAAA